MAKRSVVCDVVEFKVAMDKQPYTQPVCQYFVSTPSISIDLELSQPVWRAFVRSLKADWWSAAVARVCAELLAMTDERRWKEG